MKNLYLFLLAAVVASTSCKREVDPLWDEGASHRMTAALDDCRRVLLAAPNGWMGDYYPETDYKIGGYAMNFRFHKDGTADISCETQTRNAPGVPATSQFDLIAEQGPVLAFRTYNRVLHYFTEPKSSSIYGDPVNDVNGYQGDHEFIIFSVADDRVELVGKRNKNRLVLHRNPASLDPKAYFDSARELGELNAGLPVLSVTVNGENIGNVSPLRHTFISDIDNGKGGTITFPYTFTAEGLRMANPVELKGVKVQNFSYDVSNRRYTCTDAGANVVLQTYLPANYELSYEDLIGTWKLTYYDTNDNVQEKTVTIAQRERYVSLSLMSPEVFSFKDGIRLSYNTSRGTIQLLGQAFPSGNYNNKPQTPQMWLYDHTRGRIIFNTSFGMNGLWNKDEGGVRKITFVDNKLWMPYVTDGFILYLIDTNGARTSFSSNVGGHVFYYLSMTKI